MSHPELHSKTFLLFLISISVGFIYIIFPFAGSVFWALVLAIVFSPIFQRFTTSLHLKPTAAALLTLILCLLLVVLPAIFITLSLINQVTDLYKQVNGGSLNIDSYFEQIMGRLPLWLVNFLNRFGLADLSDVRKTLSTSVSQGSHMIASQAVSIGQNTMNLVINIGIMLYLLFFFLRDGMQVLTSIQHAFPLEIRKTQYLFKKFTAVVRATFKGNIIVASAQGTLGGLLFWFLGIKGALLWGVVMAFLSLLPAIGAALIWGPVALYMLATGEIGKGLLIVGFGILVIGLVDNILRPLLVGKDTHLPDYVVLISTIGGMATLGLSGFVIGPTVAALFVTTWQIFADSKNDFAK
jgi:predicted PurR-regulated permease PerM